MYVKLTNEIYFPHIIPSPNLSRKAHTWNNVNGGAISISDLNIDTNSFFGGNVTRLGWINEYGFYACQNLYSNDNVLGFYIHDPSKVTDIGKQLVKEAFPSCKVVFEIYHDAVMSEDEQKNLSAARVDALEHGLAPELISHSNAAELKALIASVQSGHTATRSAELASSVASPMLTEDVEHVHIGGMPKKTVLAGKTQPRSNGNHRR